MRVRLRQPAVEARRWDGDLPRMREWLSRVTALDDSQVLGDGRLRVSGRFSYSLAEGDWLVASNDRGPVKKVLKDEFEKKYERAGPHEPVSGWTPMVQAQHELTVMIPGMLLEMGRENWVEFCKWFSWFATDTEADPEKSAYSIG